MPKPYTHIKSLIIYDVQMSQFFVFFSNKGLKTLKWFELQQVQKKHENGKFGKTPVNKVIMCNPVSHRRNVSTWVANEQERLEQYTFLRTQDRMKDKPEKDHFNFFSASSRWSTTLLMKEVHCIQSFANVKVFRDRILHGSRKAKWKSHTCILLSLYKLRMSSQGFKELCKSDSQNIKRE